MPENQNNPVPQDSPEMPDSPAPAAPAEVQAVQSKRRYLRFSVFDRIEHWVFITSFLTLGLTGLVQRYATSPLSQAIVNAFGGIENTRLIHHIAAVVMMFSVIYHIGAVGYKVYVNRVRLSMLPGTYDLSAFLQSITYFIGRKKNPPQQGRFTFEEKIEYWAVVWGTIVMGVTGFMMWNPIFTTRLLDGQFIPAAKFAHSMEAVLAVLSILIWHFYHIFIKTLNKSMFTGKLNEEQMTHEHPLELADIKAGESERLVDPKEKAKRQKIFFPTYGVFAALMLVGVWFFVTYEQTAITTVPPIPEDVEIYVPFTPTPLPTALPTNTPSAVAGSPTWENSIALLFSDRCGACHGTVAKLANLDFSTYETALVGGQSGPVIIPGDAAGSLLIQIQSAGGHPGQLTPGELQSVTDWINAGAPEK
jgi:formate dehydrogenase gamma subunit